MMKKNLSVIVVLIIAVLLIVLVIVVSNGRIREIEAKAAPKTNH